MGVEEEKGVGDESGNGDAGVHPHTNENTRKMIKITESAFFIVHYSNYTRTILQYALRPTTFYTVLSIKL